MMELSEIKLSYILAIISIFLSIIAGLVALSDFVSYSNYPGRLVTYVVVIDSTMLLAQFLLVLSPLLSIITIAILLRKEE